MCNMISHISLSLCNITKNDKEIPNYRPRVMSMLKMISNSPTSFKGFGNDKNSYF